MSWHTAIVPPQGVWWKPAGKQERRWIAIAFVWCLVLFAMMPFWHIRGGQNPSGIRSTVEPKDFALRVERFISDYQVRLLEGATYTLHISSLDVNHGFSLYPANVNFQIVPGYDYGLQMTPNTPGDYKIICNEFCGIGHHRMLGKVIVLPKSTVASVGEGGSK
jgi:cytochrome c oxidase subunit 2